MKLIWQERAELRFLTSHEVRHLFDHPDVQKYCTMSNSIVAEGLITISNCLNPASPRKLADACGHLPMYVRKLISYVACRVSLSCMEMERCVAPWISCEAKKKLLEKKGREQAKIILDGIRLFTEDHDPSEPHTDDE